MLTFLRLRGRNLADDELEPSEERESRTAGQVWLPVRPIWGNCRRPDQGVVLASYGAPRRLAAQPSATRPVPRSGGSIHWDQRREVRRDGCGRKDAARRTNRRTPRLGS